MDGLGWKDLDAACNASARGFSLGTVKPALRMPGGKGWVTKPQLCITDIKSYVSLRVDPYEDNLYLLTVDMKKPFHGSKSENGITWQIRASCVGLGLGAGGALL